MAMTAGLVAFAPDIDLQRLQPSASQSETVLRKLLIEPIRHHE